jgi:hypothetical protein
VRGLPAARRCWRQLAISFFSRHFRSWSLLIGQRGSGDPLPAGCIMRFERVRRRPDRLRPCLQDGARRYRVEEGLGLSFRVLPRLAQKEEPGCAGSDAGGRGGLELIRCPNNPEHNCRYEAHDK